MISLKWPLKWSLGFWINPYSLSFIPVFLWVQKFRRSRCPVVSNNHSQEDDLNKPYIILSVSSPRLGGFSSLCFITVSPTALGRFFLRNGCRSAASRFALSRRSKLFEQLETAQVFYAKRINRLVMFASRKLQLKDVQCPVQVAQHGQCCHVSAMQDSRKSGLPTRLVPEEELLKVSHISPQSHWNSASGQSSKRNILGVQRRLWPYI